MARIIKKFFNKEELSILKKYCHNKLDLNKDHQLDGQSFSPAWYEDPLMTSFLDIKLPLVEKKSNLNLIPTYAYWRYYIFGANLKQHLDRPSCEISVTACIKKYDNWPIVVEGKEFELNEGDAILYNGVFEKHWRPGVYKGNGMAQVFFHYVDKNGHFSHHGYDNYFKITKNTKSEGDLQWIKKQLI